MKTERIEIVFDELSPLRADKFLAERIPELSRATIQTMISAGQVTVNGGVLSKSSYKLESGDKIVLSVKAEADTALEQQDIHLDVIYEDTDVVVINKPSGLVIHPGAGNQQDTLVNALLFHWPEIARAGEPDRPGIVHRLDKDTSGVLIVARNHEAYTWLVRQFKNKKARKTYLALVDGRPPTPTGRIETRIGRDEKLRQRMAVTYGDKGRKAETEFFTITDYRDHTLLEVKPLTGRTHQIRVHLAFLGCPVTGDQIYGRRKKSIDLDRFFLHAGRLSIRLPGAGEETVFTAPLPADLQSVLDSLEIANA
ncbi:MAG: RluA family pseudouridine synthase [Anaerolineaceae bacterium]|nr:RluA family pseudouridine synthase [Anaerolineaceae bacterium]